MGVSPIGTVVLLSFPFADMKTYKKRPAVIVARGSLETIVICQITSRKLPNVPAISIAKNDFISGKLPVASYARPDKLFTIDETLAGNTLGLLKKSKFDEIRASIREIFA